jgi:hypothetical protein
LGLINTPIGAAFFATEALQAVSPEQQAILPLSAEADTGVVFAAVEVWVVLAEQQGLSPAALASLETLVSPAWTARANATNIDEKRSFFICRILATFDANATGIVSFACASLGESAIASREVKITDFNKMKSITRAMLALAVAVASAHAQFSPQGGGSQGFRFNGDVAKLFGANSSFSANIQTEMKGGPLTEMLKMPGKIQVADGKSRFELDVTQIKGGGLSEYNLAQMKEIGMDKTVLISRPDKKLTYVFYPNLQAYLETPMDEKTASLKESDFKLETTELGKETIDGHPCMKTRAVLTDKKGAKQEATLWNATDLKSFPVQVQKTEDKTVITMLFKDVKLAKPDAKMFDPPANSTKYGDIPSLIQGVSLKRTNQSGAVTPK